MKYTIGASKPCTSCRLLQCQPSPTKTGYQGDYADGEKLVSFRDDLDAVLKVRAGIRPSIYSTSSDTSSNDKQATPQDLLTRKAFADLYISIYMGFGGQGAITAGLSNWFSSPEIYRTPTPNVFEQDINPHGSESGGALNRIQPSAEDKKMWQGASVQATRLQTSSLGTCPVRALTILYKKMSPFNMFFKQTLLVSLKRQQFAFYHQKKYMRRYQ